MCAAKQMWAALPRCHVQLRSCRHFSTVLRSSAPAAGSESSFGLLQAIEGADPTGGRVLSASRGLARVTLPGPVSVGASVDLGDGASGVVFQYDSKGATVATLSRQQPRIGALASMGATLSLKAPSPSAEASVTFASVLDMLDSGSDPATSSELMRLPRMPPPSRRQPVSQLLPSGLAAVESLLPLGIGQRVGLVGPAGTGKSTAARMLLASQPNDAVCVYAALRPVQQLEAHLKNFSGASLTVVHADPMQDTTASQYLVPFCALQLAKQLQASHQHVILILDDLVAFAAAAAELEVGSGRSSGLPPQSVATVLGAALDAGGTVLDQAGKESSLSVLAVVDLDPDDMQPSAMRGLWRGVEPSLDVCLRFSARVAADGILPAIDPKELLAFGFAPRYQIPLLSLLRTQLCSKLREGYDLAWRMQMAKELSLQMEDDEHENLVSSTNARSLFMHAVPQSLPEIAVLLCAALVYKLPARRPSPVAIARFQLAVVGTVRDEHPALWSALESMDSLNEAESEGVMQNLGEALMRHRFDFDLTRPDL